MNLGTDHGRNNDSLSISLLTVGKMNLERPTGRDLDKLLVKGKYSTDQSTKSDPEAILSPQKNC